MPLARDRSGFGWLRLRHPRLQCQNRLSGDKRSFAGVHIRRKERSLPNPATAIRQARTTHAQNTVLCKGTSSPNGRDACGRDAPASRPVRVAEILKLARGLHYHGRPICCGTARRKAVPETGPSRTVRAPAAFRLPGRRRAWTLFGPT